jgi:hypothetical protein
VSASRCIGVRSRGGAKTVGMDPASGMRYRATDPRGVCEESEKYWAGRKCDEPANRPTVIDHLESVARFRAKLVQQCFLRNSVPLGNSQ